jgi:rhamnogalacturonyl hydrolase YesR
MLDPDSYPSPETSGTGFFTYALAWGINNGMLDEATYMPVVKKGWQALAGAVHTDGKLGYVQAIGADPQHTEYGDTEVPLEQILSIQSMVILRFMVQVHFC